MLVVCIAFDDTLDALIDILAVLRLVRKYQLHCEAPDDSDLVTWLEALDLSITELCLRVCAEVLRIDLFHEHLVLWGHVVVLGVQLGLGAETQIGVLVIDDLGPGSLEEQDPVGRQLTRAALDAQMCWEGLRESRTDEEVPETS